MKKAWFWLAALLALAPLCALAEVRWQGPQGAVVRAQEAAGETWLLLPSCADAAALSLTGAARVRGELGEADASSPFDLRAIASAEDGVYRVTAVDESGAETALSLLFSQGVRALFLQSDDPQEQGRAWVEGDAAHERSAEGSLLLLRPDGTAAASARLSGLRGRGNSTWYAAKKPYQITLEDGADLLETGLKSESNRRWVLLSEAFDGSLLRNRVCLALARELGIPWTPECETVDLYYDGEYRGVYSLTEKVEVNEGRVEIGDGDEAVERANPDVESLSEIIENAMKYTVGLQDVDCDYLIELDKNHYGREKCWFALGNGATYSIASPERCSQGMAERVRARFQQVDDALANYGVHPQTGARWEELLDAETLLPYFALNELVSNPDVWSFSSTYFTLCGDTLRVGPVWDFDLALKRRPGQSAAGLNHAGADWGAALYRVPDFQELLQAYYADTLLPLVRNVLLGEQERETLKPLDWYERELAASARMNGVLWPQAEDYGELERGATWTEDCALLRACLTERADWLADEIASWPGTAPASEATLTLSVPYGHAEDAQAEADDIHSGVRLVSQSATRLTEADAEHYALWRQTITLAAKPGVALAEEITVTVNGSELVCTPDEDGTFSLAFDFEDGSYRPAEYEGTDYGLVFDAAYYAARYPDTAAECGGDAEAMLAYFVDWGAGEGQQGNAYFCPAEIAEALPDVAEMLGENWDSYLTFFLEAGYEDWMARMGKRYEPQAQSVASAVPEG